MAENSIDSPEIDDLWDYADPAASEARFRSHLMRTAPDSGVYLELLTQIARAQGLQRNFAGANETLTKVKPVLPPGVSRACIRYLLECGRVCNSSGQKSEASARFLEAWRLARDAGEDFFAIDAAHMLAISEPLAAQAAWNLRAIDAAEQSAQPRARNWLGSLYNNLGWTCHDQGDYAQALDLFQRALRFRQTQDKPAEILVARWCVARCLRSLGRPAEALAEQQSLAADYAIAGTQDGYVEEELGEGLQALGQPAEARPHFMQAYALLAQDPWLVESEPARLERLKQLGQ